MRIIEWIFDQFIESLTETKPDEVSLKDYK